MENPQRPPAKRRGAGVDPPNRFERTHAVTDLEHANEPLPVLQVVQTEFITDETKTIVASNDSPDVGFRYSINPYRGCEHGCSYCYARPTHEYLGMNAGLDFETRIMVKEDGPELLREFLRKPTWQAEQIVMSGVTDPYQPVERKLQITRGCLEVMLEARQPVGIITKNAMVARDVDLLSEMAKLNLANVCVSVTSLDPSLQRELEPRASPPQARLDAIATLASAGVHVTVMIGPVIPGLNEAEIPKILEACAAAGARSSTYVMLRLPLSVRPIFLDWLERLEPLKRSKVEALLRSVREGKLNDTEFGRRMVGRGERADQVKQMFKLFSKKHGLDGGMPKLDSSQFRPPMPTTGQLQLF